MLDSLVPDSGWHLIEADDISDRKEIVGYGDHRRTAARDQLNLGPCRVCVSDLELQQRELPSGTWQDVGPRGTVDGNPCCVRVRVANHDDQPHVFQLKARDEPEQIDEAPTVSSTRARTSGSSSSGTPTGSAWKDGAPDADHVLRVRAVLGHTIFGGRSAVLKFRPRPLVLVPGALEQTPRPGSAYRDLVSRANPDWEAYPVTGLRHRSMVGPRRTRPTRSTATARCWSRSSATCATRRTPATSTSSPTGSAA